MMSRMKKLLIGIVVMCLAPVPSAEADDLERCIELWERLDREVMTADFDDRPLGEVVEEISRQLAIPLRADWEALDELAIRRGSEVTLRVEFAHATSALRGMAQSLGASHRRPLVEPFGDQIVLTSPAGAAAMRFTACYDIRDLLGDEAVIERLKRPSDAPDQQGNPAQAAGDEVEAADVKNADDPGEVSDDGNEIGDVEAAASDAPPRPLTPGEKLAWLLTDHVDPDAWIDFGGNRASISERDGVLIISAPPSTHIRVRDALRRLRQAHGSSVLLEAAIVDLPLNAFQLLQRGHEPGSASMANAVLTGDNAKVLWRTTGVFAPGSPMSIESDSDGVSIALDVDATLDDSGTNLRLSAKATSVHQGDRRSVQTTATMTEKRGGAIIEMPAAVPSQTVRVLVLLVRPG